MQRKVHRRVSLITNEVWTAAVGVFDGIGAVKVVQRKVKAIRDQFSLWQKLRANEAQEGEPGEDHFVSVRHD